MQLEIQITIQYIHRKSKRAHMKPLQHKAPGRAAVTAKTPRLWGSAPPSPGLRPTDWGSYWRRWSRMHMEQHHAWFQK